MEVCREDRRGHRNHGNQPQNDLGRLGEGGPSLGAGRHPTFRFALEWPVHAHGPPPGDAGVEFLDGPTDRDGNHGDSDDGEQGRQPIRIVVPDAREGIPPFPGHRFDGYVQHHEDRVSKNHPRVTPEVQKNRGADDDEPDDHPGDAVPGGRQAQCIQHGPGYRNLLDRLGLEGLRAKHCPHHGHGREAYQEEQDFRDRMPPPLRSGGQGAASRGFEHPGDQGRDPRDRRGDGDGDQGNDRIRMREGNPDSCDGTQGQRLRAEKSGIGSAAQRPDHEPQTCRDGGVAQEVGVQDPVGLEQDRENHERPRKGSGHEPGVAVAGERADQEHDADWPHERRGAEGDHVRGRGDGNARRRHQDRAEGMPDRRIEESGRPAGIQGADEQRGRVPMVGDVPNGVEVERVVECLGEVLHSPGDVGRLPDADGDAEGQPDPGRARKFPIADDRQGRRDRRLGFGLPTTETTTVGRANDHGQDGREDHGEAKGHPPAPSEPQLATDQGARAQAEQRHHRGEGQCVESLDLGRPGDQQPRYDKAQSAYDEGKDHVELRGSSDEPGIGPD